MGLGCSTSDENLGSWTSLKARLLRSAEVRKYTRKPLHIRPRFLMIRRRTRYVKKLQVCCCNRNVICVPAIQTAKKCDYKTTRSTITNSNCQICTQNETYQSCYQYGDGSPKRECKFCAREIILKSSKSCCTENVDESSDSQNSPEAPIKNVCRFTVDAYFT
ncbi:hypothetical protein evm_001321 [Chilo suppressalis]|nr:hypothetical protein evm_001321 [Chilo suppressalis]